MILGRDHQAANGRAPWRIALFIFVEQSEQAGFQLVESRLADARDHGSKRCTGIAQQLSEVAFRDGGERGHELGELGFCDRSGAFFGEPLLKFNTLASLGGCHEVMMTF